MQHREARRDPTILVVIGLVLVIGIALLLRQSGGDDGGKTPTSSDATKTREIPTVEPTISESGLRIRNAPKPIKKIPTRCVAKPNDTEITVVSYNVKSLVAGANADNVAATARAAGADIVLLQEIKNAPNVGNQPGAIAERLGMEYVFGQNVSYGSGGYGTAVLSAYPIISSDNTHLPRPGNTQQRGLLHVVVNVDGKPLSIYDTHLQNKSPGARVAQMSRIVQIVAPDEFPGIMGGDMNAHYGTREMSIARSQFVDTWESVGVGSGLTHPASNLRGRIDYLFHRNTGITPVTSDVLGARLSDHLAVRASYVIDGPGGKVCELVPETRKAELAWKVKAASIRNGGLPTG